MEDAADRANVHANVDRGGAKVLLIESPRSEDERYRQTHSHTRIQAAAAAARGWQQGERIHDSFFILI